MKLYTEEQVNKMLSRARLHNQDDTEMFTNEYLIAYETPIELPSDEDLEKARKENRLTMEEMCRFEEGVEWLIKRINNQNK